METAQKPKVLIVITKANFGGAQRYVLDIASAALAAGFDTTVVYGTPGVLAKKLDDQGIKTIELTELGRDVSLFKDYRSFRQLLSTIKKETPQVLHLNSSKIGILGGVAGRMASVPKIIFTAHAWAFNEGRPAWQKVFIAFLQYLTVLLAHETLCNSQATRRSCAWMPFVQKKIRVIRLGISPIDLKARSKAREQLSPENSNAFWIGMVTELHKSKGVFEAIEAFETVAKEYPDTRLIIAGEGSERDALLKDIHTRGLDEKVVLLGYVADAPTYLPAFDIFLFPSRTEALGLALLEAGLAGLPAIGTAVGGIPEIIEHRKTGLLIPSKNPKCIKEMLMILMKDVVLRHKLGEALKKKVEKEFSKEKMLALTLAEYR